jgi:hypothetical protein
MMRGRLGRMEKRLVEMERARAQEAEREATSRKREVIASILTAGPRACRLAEEIAAMVDAGASHAEAAASGAAGELAGMLEAERARQRAAPPLSATLRGQGAAVSAANANDSSCAFRLLLESDEASSILPPIQFTARATAAGKREIGQLQQQAAR